MNTVDQQKGHYGMLRNFVRGFDDALPKDMCNSLIEWFESEPVVRTEDVNRVSRKDKQVCPALPLHDCQHAWIIPHNL